MPPDKFLKWQYGIYHLRTRHTRTKTNSALLTQIRVFAISVSDYQAACPAGLMVVRAPRLAVRSNRPDVPPGRLAGWSRGLPVTPEGLVSKQRQAKVASSGPRSRLDLGRNNGHPAAAAAAREDR